MVLMSTDHAPVPRVANRYGAPKPARISRKTRQRLVWAVLGLAVVGTGVFSFAKGTPAVSSKDVGFNIEAPNLARVDFEVNKEPGVTAQCAVQVLNESYAVVGWTVVSIPAAAAGEGPNQGRTTSHTARVRTESEGVSGGVNACWIVQDS